MVNPQIIITYFVAIFTTLVMYYSLIKVVRTAILSTNRWLNLDDINILFFASVIVSLVVIQNNTFIKIIFFIPVIFYSLLLWIDALIFYLYSFEINKQNISEFLKDSKSILHYSQRSFELLKRYPWLIFSIPLSIIALIEIFFSHGSLILIAMIIPIILVLSIFVLQKFKQAVIRNVILLSIILIMTFILMDHLIIISAGFVQKILFYTAILITVVIVILNTNKNRLQHTFFTLTSHFRKFLFDDKLLYNPSIKIKNNHEKLLFPSYQKKCEPTEYFGILKGANVILITMESLGAKYLTDKLRTPFLSKLAKGAVSSKEHYALSPHTNQFLIHLFNSNYVQSDRDDPQELLHKANYHTAFISSANCNICETNVLLKNIGFNEIIDQNELYGINKSPGDYLLLDSINSIKRISNQAPYFVQILTVQSHYPYDIFNKKKFGSKAGSDLKTKYLTTIEETDYTLDLMFSELSKFISLDNTLVVYVGDHGESFGELGYKAHSNSTINAQLKVPFYLKHNALKQQSVKYSTHFDIMPTILDLLGIENNSEIIGTSIFSKNRELPSLFYSMVRKGNAPANVKIRLNDKNIMIDRVLDYFLIIDEDDNIIRHLTKDETLYYSTLAYEMLLNRNLIY